MEKRKTGEFLAAKVVSTILLKSFLCLDKHLIDYKRELSMRCVHIRHLEELAHYIKSFYECLRDSLSSLHENGPK